MLALARIGVLVEGSPVEEYEAVRVFRKMGRHPIDNDAESSLVARVYEKFEVVGRAEARCRREIPDHLVAP